MNKFTVVAILVILALFGGLIVWTTVQKEENPTSVKDYDSTKIIAGDNNNGNIGDHVRGNADNAGSDNDSIPVHFLSFLFFIPCQ